MIQKWVRIVPPRYAGAKYLEPGALTSVPPAAAMFLVFDGNGYYLEGIAADGELAGDTWHLTLDDAFRQAYLDYEIPREAWIDIPQHVRGLCEVRDYVLAQVNGPGDHRV